MSEDMRKENDIDIDLLRVSEYASLGNTDAGFTGPLEHSLSHSKRVLGTSTVSATLPQT